MNKVSWEIAGWSDRCSACIKHLVLRPCYKCPIACSKQLLLSSTITRFQLIAVNNFTIIYYFVQCFKIWNTFLEHLWVKRKFVVERFLMFPHLECSDSMIILSLKYYFLLWMYRSPLAREMAMTGIVWTDVIRPCPASTMSMEHIDFLCN